MTWLRSVERNSVVEVREKLSRPLAISAARKLCCVILSSTGPRRASPLQLLGQHLRVGGDDGERGVDLVGDAGGEQADGAELVGLGELRFQGDALGDVVDQDDAAHGNEVAREQRRNGDVGGAQLAGARGQAELVEVMHARLAAETFQRLNELQRKDGTKFLADGFGAAEGVHGLHLRVPAFDAVVEVDGEDAHVDGLDDVLVELLEALELGDLFFQAGVEAGVLQGDADVAGEGFEQLDIFARQEVAAEGAAEADDGDGAAGGFVLRLVDRLGLSDAAREIVVQVEQGCGALLVFRQMNGSLRVFEEDVRVVLGAVEVEEAEGQIVLRGADFVGQAVRGGETQAA